MAGADYDYTKSLLPAGNGAIHAMSGGGYGQPQEGGSIARDNFAYLKIEDMGPKNYIKKLLLNFDETENEELILNRELLISLFSRLDKKDNLINTYITDTSNNIPSNNINTCKYKIEVKKDNVGRKLYDLSSQLYQNNKNVGTVILSNITGNIIDLADKPGASFNNIRGAFLNDFFNALDIQKDQSIFFNITFKRIIDSGNKKPEAIPKLVSIEPNDMFVPLSAEKIKELADKYKFLQVGGGPNPEPEPEPVPVPVPDPTPIPASSVPDYGAQANAVTVEINKIRDAIVALKASAAKLSTDGSQQPLIQKVTDLETEFNTVIANRDIEYYILTAKDKDEDLDIRAKAVTDLEPHYKKLKEISDKIDPLQKEIDAVLVPGATATPGPGPGSVPPTVPVVPSEKIITVLNTQYKLMLPVQESDFDNLDEPDIKDLKKLHHDFGLDYITDGAQKANTKKAEFVNNLEKCQSFKSTFKDENCDKFRGIVSEIIQNIVGMDNIPVVTTVGALAAASAPAAPGPGTPRDYVKEADQLQKNISSLAEEIMNAKSPLETKIANITDDAKRTVHEASLKTIVDTFTTNYPVTQGTDPTKAKTDPLVLITKDTSKNDADYKNAIAALTTIKDELEGIKTKLVTLTGSVAADQPPSAGSTPRDFVAEHTAIETEVLKLRENISVLQKEIGDKIAAAIAAAPAGAAAGAGDPKETKEQELQKELETFNTALQSFYDNADPAKPKITLDTYLTQIKADIADASKAEAAIKSITSIRDTLTGKVKALEAIKGKLTGKAQAQVGGVKKGIKQGGNTCYFASAIQYINHIIPLRDAIINNKLDEPDNKDIIKNSKGDPIENPIEKFKKYMTKKTYEDKLQKVTDDKTALEKQYIDTFTKKTSKTKQVIQGEKQIKKGELIKIFNHIVSSAIFTSAPSKVVSDKLISKDIVTLLFKINKMVPESDRKDLNFLKKDFTTLVVKVEDIDTTKQEIMSVIADNKSLHDLYTTLKSNYDEYNKLVVEENRALDQSLKLPDTAMDDKAKNAHPYIKRIAEFDEKITSINNVIKNWKEKNPDDIIKNAMAALKSIIEELNDDKKPGPIDIKSGPINRFEQITAFMPGEFGSCSQEDSFSFLSDIIFELLGCYKITNDILKNILSITDIKETICTDDNTKKDQSQQTIPIKIISLKTDQTGNFVESDIQTIINLKETIETDEKDICNELPEAGAVITNTFELLPTTQYLLISLNRSLGGNYNMIETKANYNIQVGDAKLKLIGAIMKSGGEGAGHYVFQTVKDDGKGNAVQDITFNDGNVLDSYGVMNIDNNGILFLYQRESVMGGGQRRLGQRGRTQRMSRIAPEQSGGKRTLKARVTVTTVQASSPGPAQTRRRPLKARTTQSRTERSRVSGRLPIRRAAGK